MRSGANSPESNVHLEGVNPDERRLQWIIRDGRSTEGTDSANRTSFVREETKDPGDAAQIEPEDGTMTTTYETLLKCPYCSHREVVFENLEAYYLHVAFKHKINFEKESPLDPIELLVKEE